MSHAANPSWEHGQSVISSGGKAVPLCLLVRGLGGVAESFKNVFIVAGSEDGEQNSWRGEGGLFISTFVKRSVLLGTLQNGVPKLIFSI